MFHGQRRRAGPQGGQQRHCTNVDPIQGEAGDRADAEVVNPKALMGRGRRPPIQPPQTQVTVINGGVVGEEEAGFWGPGTKNKSKRPSHNAPSGHTTERVMPVMSVPRQDQHGIAAREAMPSSKGMPNQHAAHRDNIGALINYKFAGAMHDAGCGEMKYQQQSNALHEQQINDYHDQMAATPQMQPAHVIRTDVTASFAATGQGPRPFTQRRIW